VGELTTLPVDITGQSVYVPSRLARQHTAINTADLPNFESLCCMTLVSLHKIT